VIKPLIAVKGVVWTTRRSARIGLHLKLVALSALTACTSARPPTVLNAGITDAAPTGLAIASAEIRGPQRPNAVVTFVTDGDTINVDLLKDHTLRPPDSESTFSPSEKLRLIGIDTPESKRPNTPIECFAEESRVALKQLLPDQTPILLELDIEHRDRYGRLLAYVFRASDGLFVNHEMVRSGMAASLTYPPNVAYSDQFFQAASAARANSVGLWSSCASEHEPKPKNSEQAGREIP
jgi:micrococcal nuclease